MFLRIKNNNMKKNTLSTLGLTIFFGLSISIFSTLTPNSTFSAYANEGGSPGSRTNSPGDAANCTGCHSGAINTGPGVASITAPSLANGYVPGQTYTITGTISQSAINKFGFEITAERNFDNSKTGTLLITNATRTRFILGNTGVTHILAGTSGAGTNSWSFDWTAPVVGTGVITFYGAFNSTNSGFNSAGDMIYTTSLTVQENLSVDVSENTSESVINLYPNPANNYINISSDEKIDQIEIYNLRGKKMAGFSEFDKGINIEKLPVGIYFIKLKTEEGLITKKFIKQ